ncbi:hypothetical protein A1O1_06097 [Capronia coronata CBS 617.96]|uniref:Uncharacterized protein n=1 Tax=Capronia coronata CBS 617.96 TaxID=1182541 RepID=W9YTX6_9EURO|nr:uncharacterized protein A1O1_06097 [Capronia coronata CBS 617.96]EXJ85729.1 hypothetical protein A1O1_06097 [Capronia coronata CBS 617.96]
MPPLRTTPPAKAIKTERTHEENQERAYIAASRRSDRSLEARVESARRASEIHKRRTGRSLRVTEQDVINEEMYEEEDDDLPLQYRRLTAHLQTGSADFNRRLAAYLTNQVAMRSAMEQMIQNPYAQYPNAATYQSRPNMFSSPLLSHPNMASPAATGSYRPSPYPSPHQANFRSNHGRAFSMASIPTRQERQSPPSSDPPGSLDHRRLSTPATIQLGDTSAGQVNTDGIKPDPEYMRQTQSATLSAQQNHGGGGHAFSSSWQDMGPFTTTLPPESQQMFAHAPGFDHNDPSYAMLMHGSDQYVSSPYYPWHDMRSGGGVKGMPVHASAYQGMSATLAPSVLEQSVESAHSQEINSESTPTNTHGSTASSAADRTASDASSLPTAGLDFNFSQESKGLDFGGAMPLTSGQITPAGEGFWDHFVMDGSWDDGAEVEGAVATG